MILNQNHEVPEDERRRQIRMIVRGVIDTKNFEIYTYQIEIENVKFSSKIYEARVSKKDDEVMD